MRSSLRRSIFALVAIFAAPLGSALAASFDDGVAAYNRNDFATAAAVFTQLAEGGDPQAQHNLGLLYLEGKGVARDDAQAMFWYRKSADQGFASSQFDVGLMFEDGEGVPADAAAAIAWYTKASDQNYLPAEEKLADIYIARKDFADALVWVRKAADQGDPGEQFNLGSFYFNGWAAPKDDAQARLWYSKAAAQGSEAAAAVLKRMP
jgi:TPR repeat protein